MKAIRSFHMNGQSCKPQVIIGGVAQGSILGLTVFLFYINDLLMSILRKFVNNYTDDTTVHRSTIKTLDDRGLAADLSATFKALDDHTLVLISPLTFKSLDDQCGS